MKKLMAVMLVFVMLLSFAACGAKSAATDPVGAAANAPAAEAPAAPAANVSSELLEAAGISEEEFAAMDPEMQQALLDELGYAAQAEKEKEEKKEEVKEKAPITPDQVSQGGSYKVVLGDYMNSITLYYENGKLVKIVEEFQKNSEEEAECYVYEGDALAEYGFNFIDWDNASLQDILDGMKDYGGFGQYQIYEE